MNTLTPLPLALLLLGGAPAAQAQYKIVAPDGTVTYADRPPPTSSPARVAPIAAPAARAPASAPVDPNAGLPALPLALREPAARFPVTLYAATDCDPCDRGRTLLRQRGIPFRERLASTPADHEAWSRIVGSPDAPTLTVGRQMLRGFAADQWQSTLDLAGYPRDSRLPPNYRAPAPAPLAEPREAAPAAAAPRAPTPAEPAPPVSSGIRF